MQVLAALPWLRNLNLKGCGLAQKEDYPQSVLRMLPTLDVLDNKRMAQRSKQAKAAVQTVTAAGIATAKAAGQLPTQHVAEVPHRKDRTKSASTVAATVGKTRTELHSRDEEMHVSEAGPRSAVRVANPEVAPGIEAKQKKKRAKPEQIMMSASKQAAVIGSAAERHGAGLKKKQRLQDKERVAEKLKAVSVPEEPAGKTASNSSRAKQEGELPDQKTPHRPPVVGVFEAQTAAGGKKQLKLAALARGAQVYTCLKTYSDVAYSTV